MRKRQCGSRIRNTANCLDSIVFYRTYDYFFVLPGSQGSFLKTGEELSWKKVLAYILL